MNVLAATFAAWGEVAGLALVDVDPAGVIVEGLDPVELELTEETLVALFAPPELNPLQPTKKRDINGSAKSFNIDESPEDSRCKSGAYEGILTL